MKKLMRKKEAEFLDDTSPDEIENGVSDKKWQEWKKLWWKKGWMSIWHFPQQYGEMWKCYKWWQEWIKWWEKKAEFIDDTSPDEMEEGVNDRKNNYYEEKK